MQAVYRRRRRRLSAEAKEQARAYRVEPRRNLRRVREKGEKTMPEWMIDFLANELRVWEDMAVEELEAQDNDD